MEYCNILLKAVKKGNLAPWRSTDQTTSPPEQFNNTTVWQRLPETELFSALWVKAKKMEVNSNAREFNRKMEKSA
jgi:hypothetical protein